LEIGGADMCDVDEEAGLCEWLFDVMPAMMDAGGAAENGGTGTDG
jgi:hypothetical protein